MTVIPGIPRAPKGIYRPANVIPNNEVDHQAITHDPNLSLDPYLHPSYAHAYRRPASPIAEGKFDPSVHATSIRRARSLSRQDTASASRHRSRSVSGPPLVIPTGQPMVATSHRRHGSSGSVSTHPSSQASSPASRPQSVGTSPEPSPPPSPNHPASAKPVVPPLRMPDPDDDEVDPVTAILSGSTRGGKLTKRRRSEKTVASYKTGSSTSTSPLMATPDPPKVKSRSGFGFFRFGKAAAGRMPVVPSHEAMLPPERQPSMRDKGEPSGRFLSPASSFVMLDGPPTPPTEPVGILPLEAPRVEGVRGSALQHRDSPIYGLEGNRYLQGDNARIAQTSASVDRVDGLDTTGPYGFAYHNSGPYDAIGSVVGSARNSRLGDSQVGIGAGSPANMRHLRSHAPPSIAGSSVRTGHRVYPGVGAAMQPQSSAGGQSPYPPNIEFIPEALAPSQLQAYSSSRTGSAGSGHSAGAPSAGGEPVIPQGFGAPFGEHSRERLAFQDSHSMTGGEYPSHERPHSDNFYSGQQPRFAAPPEDRSYSQREDGQWDGDHGSEYGGAQDHHRRSSDEEMKYVPLRVPVVNLANDVQSHYGHESQIYSEHRSHRSGAGSILSGSSAGRASLPPKHVPRSLVMPSPLQGQHGSPPLAPEGSPPGGYGHRHSRSPAHYSNISHSRDHSRGRSSMGSAMGSSWQSPGAFQPQAAVIPMNSGKGGKLHKRY